MWRLEEIVGNSGKTCRAGLATCENKIGRMSCKLNVGKGVWFSVLQNASIEILAVSLPSNPSVGCELGDGK